MAQARVSKSEKTEVVTDSDRIRELIARSIVPGDFVKFRYLPTIYVGDGYAVFYDELTKTVVKKFLPGSTYHRRWFVRYNKGKGVHVFPPEERVKRALQQVGQVCPVKDGSADCFVLWCFFGFGFKQCKTLNTAMPRDQGRWLWTHPSIINVTNNILSRNHRSSTMSNRRT